VLLFGIHHGLKKHIRLLVVAFGCASRADTADRVFALPYSPTFLEYFQFYPVRLDRIGLSIVTTSSMLLSVGRGDDRAEAGVECDF